MTPERKERIKAIARLILHAPSGLTVNELSERLGAGYSSVYDDLG